MKISTLIVIIVLVLASIILTDMYLLKPIPDEDAAICRNLITKEKASLFCFMAINAKKCPVYPCKTLQEEKENR